jgi:hypothetical protein
MEKYVPYKTGETPDIGDTIRNSSGKTGIVRQVHRSVGQNTDDEKLTIKWDEGVLEIYGYSARDHLLISKSE